jgi:two-component system, chemotaxis family, sensor kinase CheA
VDVDETLKEFLVESQENLDQLDRDFVALENEPDQRERLGAIFRTIHTIKGNSGFLGLHRLETLAHAGESLLSLLRDGTIQLTPNHVSALLSMVDHVREALKAIEATGAEPKVSYDAAIQRLADARSAAATPAPTATVKSSAPRAPSDKPAIRPSAAASEAPFVTPAAAPVPAERAPAAARGTRPPTSARASASPPKAPATAPPAAEPREGGSPSLADTSVRVDVALLDKLMNLVGELVLSRNQILQFGARFDEAAGAAQRLNLITTELQEQVMKTRMQPIGNVWSKLPRVVRDLAIMCRKQVRVAMIGKETELDRTILEAIKDPLTHVVRNAVDHGIETSEARLAAGKSRTGTLTLRAYHEGGQVNIEIADDGAGINAEAVRRKAVERNVVSAERAAAMTEAELIQLVFMPGFSTAEKISNVSGRGVGMDVVKTNIERIGGTVDLRAQAGRGTTLHIKIPLTLAIVPALVVDSGAQRYAVPQASLVELFRVDGDQVHKVIERVHGTPVYRLRGKLLPIVFLAQQLRGSATYQLDTTKPSFIVVLQADNRHFGLVVDDVRDTEEIVVKPLGKELREISILAGATIMGDGRVALILDVVGLAHHAGVVAGGDASKPVKLAAREEDAAPAADLQTLLLFDTGDREMAVALSKVARLEEFTPDMVEREGSRRVVQYRGSILPLIELADIFDEHQDASDAPIHVIVYTEGEHSIGFVVARILDVTEGTVNLTHPGSRRGVLGAAVVNGKIVEFLDVHGLVEEHRYLFASARAA